MAQAASKHITKLSELFIDPFLRAVFRAAEDDGTAPSLVEADYPRQLNGGAAERILEPEEA
jgi:hypothetical protein